ncbi:sorting nexin-20-like isoform X1 [Uranotaenia lowii]|uniref:sorting nexin-20-like isoform X1 n=1 Tax=Uranotaenia lowii TaxID=190385 RepID=UPI00247A6E14|nr:sorting nexin-20-like isoform X1 [Uranotaenia lowii]XP_055595346.1 sorting nexin-20-like isoform X1 [Uranotaenia lowii]XP_055595347.1 sorting nexin-20-like isoform X1 [Uranotaenia lowii]
MHPAVVGHRVTIDTLNAATGGSDPVENDPDPDSPVEEAFEESMLSIDKRFATLTTTAATVPPNSFASGLRRHHGQDIWRRPSSRAGPSDSAAYFEILFARILPSGDGLVAEGCAASSPGGKRYVVYDVSVRKNNDSASDPHPTTIERRYTHFLKLYESLRKESPQLLQSVNFPKKVLMGNFSQELAGERSMAFESFLDYIITVPSLRDSEHFLEFLQSDELRRAGQLVDERRYELAVPILENIFRVLNKIFLDKSKWVLLLLCRLVTACTTSPIPHPQAEQWAELALRRYEHVCDTELLVLYIPLLQTCLHLWWQRGRDRSLLEQRLDEMGKKGIKVKGGPTLAQAIHALDPRSETT